MKKSQLKELIREILKEEKVYGREELIRLSKQFVLDAADDINHSGLDEEKKMKVVDILLDTMKNALKDAVKQGYKT